MKIEISSGGKDDPRKVVVTEGDTQVASFDAPSLKEAHKMLKRGRTDGWDTLRAKPKKGS